MSYNDYYGNDTDTAPQPYDTDDFSDPYYDTNPWWADDGGGYDWDVSAYGGGTTAPRQTTPNDYSPLTFGAKDAYDYGAYGNAIGDYPTYPKPGQGGVAAPAPVAGQAVSPLPGPPRCRAT
jgi:hypothetical protein